MRLILLILLLSGSPVSAQITYERGYFIDNNGQKTECFIKNKEWQNNPTSFEYSVTQGGSPHTGNISDVKEFGSYDGSKYVRATVKIDLTRDKTYQKPLLTEETLFLKVLVEGKAALYQYTIGNLNRFLFSSNGMPIQQLIHKEYLSTYMQSPILRADNTYQQQLLNDVNCAKISVQTAKKIAYRASELIKHFNKHNRCVDESYKPEAVDRVKRDWFNLGITSGVELKSLRIYDSQRPALDVDFHNKTTFRFGIQTEFILPYNKNKWGVVLDPTYQYYKDFKEWQVSPSLRRSASVNYRSVELPVGLRYYMFYKNDAKLFINGFFVIDSDFKSTINRSPNINMDMRVRPSFAFGAGWQPKRLLAAEVRYFTNRDLIGNYIYWRSEYSKISLIVSLKVF